MITTRTGSGKTASVSLLPPVIKIQASRGLLAWMLSLHIASLLLVIVVLPFGGWVKWGLSLLILGSLVFYFWSGLWGRRCAAARVLRPNSFTDWWVEDRYDQTTHLKLKEFQVYRYLVLLYFETDVGKPCMIALCIDQIDREVHRRLRAGLIAARDY